MVVQTMGGVFSTFQELFMDWQGSYGDIIRVHVHLDCAGIIPDRLFVRICGGIPMDTLASDEKASGVMIYTQTTLIIGEVVTKQQSRVSVWLRTESAPEYMHLLKPQVINLTSSTARKLTLKEMYMSTSQVIGFHLTPPTQDPMDYDESEKNRQMQPISILFGPFVFSGAIRVSTLVDLGTSLTLGRSSWMSIYNAKISIVQLPQIGEMQVPMLMVRPSQVSFGFMEELNKSL
jgi:hypothetical protein